MVDIQWIHRRILISKSLFTGPGTMLEQKPLFRLLFRHRDPSLYLFAQKRFIENSR